MEGTGATKSSDEDTPIADLFASKMSITTTKATLSLPTLVYDYSDKHGYHYVTVDVLMLSGACSEDVTVTFVSNKVINVTVVIPMTFFEAGRTEIEDAERSNRPIDTKAAALRRAATEFKGEQKKKDNRCVMSFDINLPIPIKLYHRLKPFISSYPNDYLKQRNRNNNYLVLHLDFDGLVEPEQAPRKVKESRFPLESPLAKGLDESSDDDGDDDEGNDYHGGPHPKPRPPLAPYPPKPFEDEVME